MVGSLSFPFHSPARLSWTSWRAIIPAPCMNSAISAALSERAQTDFCPNHRILRQGCCISHPSGPNSPYPGGVGHSPSSRAINGADLSQPAGPGAAAGPGDVGNGLSSPGSGSGASGLHHTRARQSRSQPLAQHINKPLRRHQWSSRNRIWTPATLHRERTEFFDTRVAGRQEIWQTVRAALEVMWDSDASSRSPALVAAIPGDETENEGEGEEEGQGASEEDAAVALATAQTILTAAGITLPTGDLAQGVYDALGNYYALPEYVVSDPLNISTQSGSKEDGGGMRDPKGELAGGDETGPGECGTDGDDEAERRREEKGKAVVDVRDQILIRARLSDGSQDVNISVGKTDSVRSIARRIAEEAQVSTVFDLDGAPCMLIKRQLSVSKRIRIAYMGKILKEGSPLPAQGWKTGHVVNALVFNR